MRVRNEFLEKLRMGAVSTDDVELRILCDIVLFGKDTQLDEATPDCLDEAGHWDYSGAGFDHATLRRIMQAQRMTRGEAQTVIMLMVMDRATRP